MQRSRCCNCLTRPCNTSHHFSGPLCSHFKGTLCFVSSNSRSDPRLHVKAQTKSIFLHVSFRAVFAGLCGMLQYQLKAKDNHKQTSSLKVMMPSFPSSAKRPIGGFALTVSVVTCCYSASGHNTDSRNNRRHLLSPLRGNHSFSPL